MLMLLVAWLPELRLSDRGVNDDRTIMGWWLPDQAPTIVSVLESSGSGEQ